MAMNAVADVSREPDGQDFETLFRQLSPMVYCTARALTGRPEEAEDIVQAIFLKLIERELPVWRVHTWDLSVDAARTFRLDRMRSARLTDTRFEARDGFDPSYLHNPRVARLLHSPAIARWKLERGARPLTDGSAIADVPFKTEEWLLSEVLADRGETTSAESLVRDLDPA